MSTSLELSFPWGQYHATPWGRHVNEAATEWPPSPWRLLRALHATWKARAPWLSDSVVQDLLSRLAEPPSFQLPEFVAAHTRHYMPDGGHGHDLALDGFAVFERGGAIVVTWPVELAPEPRAALERLATLLPYLGRAESICDARLLVEGERGRDGLRSEPVTAAGPDLLEASLPRVLVPTAPLDIAALSADPGDVRRALRLNPPGTRWQVYTPADPASPAHHHHQARIYHPPTALRWTIDAPALPGLAATAAVTDVLRRACLGRFGKRFDGASSPLLAGKDLAGSPLSGHRHAHYLALDLDGDRLLDHLTLWVPAGLDQRALEAITSLDRLVGHTQARDFRPVRLGLEAIGDISEVAPELVGPASEWRSATPFATSRHPRRGIPWHRHMAAQVVEELEWRDHAVPTEVHPIAGDWLSFRRHRPSAGRLADAQLAMGFELTFPEPVTGPICLGALSHFGLGLFLPQG